MRIIAIGKYLGTAADTFHCQLQFPGIFFR
jgi:hypothetical protein